MGLAFPAGLEYLEKLDKFLDSEDAPPNCMQLSELDGFLTGIAVGPEHIPAQEWMAEIWDGREPVFQDEQQSVDVTAAILRRYESIRSTLADGKWNITPLFWRTEDGETLADEWAEGFMIAVRLRFDAWQPLFRHRKDSFILFPILALCEIEEDGEPPIGDDALDVEFMDAAPKLIPDAVAEIDFFWRERALTPQPVRRAVMPGRNDACPCGSGKKFKRCCGVS